MTTTTLAMNPLYALLRSLPRNRWLKWAAVMLAAAAVIGKVLSDPPAPNIAPIVLSAEPLYAKGARAKPTLTLALSVEFPTVGAQYVAAPGATDDASYSSTAEYLGYFDPRSCYVYNDTPSEALPAGATAADYKRFDWVGLAPTTGVDPNIVSLHTCNGAAFNGKAFSGNFLNWAGSSAIDILRYGLTGGDRIVDTTGLTVLQRAVLPAGRFWNDSNFPSKQVSGVAAAAALPAALLGNYTGTVYVASCFNRIHFGTAKTGNCGSPGNNSDLGVGSAGAAMGPITAYNNALPNGFSNCAGENGTCSFAGTMRIYYGANNRFYTAAATGPVSCSNNTFGDPIPGTYKQCYIGADTSGWTPPRINGSLTTDAFFYDRVSVCASDAQGKLLESRAKLCLKYPSGNFKPVGNLQKYSDKLRISAFGYLNDSTGNPNERYGGVLRAPMKYVGPKYYDASFSLVSGTNPNREWDETTGVFILNPDGQTTTPSGPGSSPTGPYLSGVTNYLNQFGRTGNFGSYKTYDPVGELYYEALRYLQGLPPTPAATVGLTPDMKDGYPVFTTWVDPHPAVAGSNDYSCVNNNIFAIGDVNTHNDKSFPGNPASRGGNENTFSSGRAADKTINEPDFHYWTQVVGGFESNTMPRVNYIDSKGVSQTTSNFNAAGSPEAPFPGLLGMADRDIGADGASYYMAGAAYWANTHDIRGSDWSNTSMQRLGMRVQTYVLDVNEFAQQTLPNAHRQNQFYLASKYGGFKDVSGRGSPYVDDKGVANSNTSWERAGAANAGETNNYYLASSAQAVLDGLDTIFDKVATQSNSIAGAAASTTRLNSANSNVGFIYQAQFDPSSWSGNVLAYPVDGSSGSVTLDNNTVPAWDAASTLDAAVAVNTTARNIVVGKTTPTSGATANPFLWNNLDANAQAALQSPLGLPMGVPTTVAAGQARLNFLRGDRSNEVPNGLAFRKRGSVLGDIVNSGVVYSGAPVPRFNDAAYATFYNANKNRKNALFVGANDGMLHAFDPDSKGAELFAYIPSWVMPRIGALTFPAYTHQSYVDATPAVADATVLDPNTGQYVWKTVLVGGTGGGGQGVYALDVSDPSAFGAGKVLWEFNDRDDPEFDLGNVVGRPQILKLRTGTVAAPNYHYFAVVASGVNNYVNDGHFSSTGRAAIYLLDLSKKATDAWAEKSNFFKIRLLDPATGASAPANGLIGFSVVKGNNDEVAQIYAGDLQGKLWKLDFTLATVGSGGWDLATLSYYHNSGGTSVPMYVAVASDGSAQPITMEPAVVYGPNKTRYVAFGTGKFLEVPDLQSVSTKQSVYAVLDNNSNVLDGGTAAAISGRGRLQPGTVNVSTGLVSIGSFVWGRPQTDADMTIRSGWYFDFTVAGERQISNAEVLSGGLLFGSIIPPVTSCGNGDGNIYSINIASGGGTLVRSPVGLLGAPFSEELGKSTIVTTTDSTGRVKVTKYFQTMIQGAEGLSASTATKPPVTSYAARLNWREVSNYQQLKAAP